MNIVYLATCKMPLFFVSVYRKKLEKEDDSVDRVESDKTKQMSKAREGESVAEPELELTEEQTDSFIRIYG